MRAALLVAVALLGLTAVRAALPEFVPDPTHNMDGNGVHKPKQKEWITPRYDYSRRRSHWDIGPDGKTRHHSWAQPEDETEDGQMRVVVVPKGDPRAHHPPGHWDLHSLPIPHAHHHHGHHHDSRVQSALRRAYARWMTSTVKGADRHHARHRPGRHHYPHRHHRASWPDVPARRGGAGYGFAPEHPHKRRGSHRRGDTSGLRRHWLSGIDEEYNRITGTHIDAADVDAAERTANSVDVEIVRASRPKSRHVPRFTPFVPFPHSQFDAPDN